MGIVSIPVKAPGDEHFSSEVNQLQPAINDNDSRIGVLESEGMIFNPILTGSSTVIQNPAGLDTVMQVSFGVAQGVPADPVQISAAGTITINKDMNIIIVATAEFGRTGGASTSELRFRVTLNGVQVSLTFSAKIDDANTTVPESITYPFTVSNGDLIEFEMYRDSSGTNNGGLFPSTCALAGWPDSPSASVSVFELLKT